MALMTSVSTRSGGDRSLHRPPHREERPLPAHRALHRARTVLDEPPHRVHPGAVGPQVLGRGEALLDAAVEPRVRAHLVRRLAHRPVPHGDDDRDGAGEVHRHADSEPPVEHGEHDEHPADEHHPAGRLRDDLPEELGHRRDVAVDPLDQLAGRVPPVELVVEAEDMPGDAHAQVVRRAPGGDRRLAGDDDGDDLRDDGDGEEDDAPDGPVSAVSAPSVARSTI